MIRKQMNETVVQKAADAAAGGSAALAGVAWFAEVEPVVTFFAGVGAIIAAAVATWYHWERATYMHRKNTEDRESQEE